MIMPGSPPSSVRISVVSRALNYIYGIDLNNINLSLSSACSADCIYCPSDRGRRIKQKMMPFDYVEKIISEISSRGFKKYHNINEIQIGENGEPFLNDGIIKILRFIKSKAPHISVCVFTNFDKFTEDKAEIILREKLINRFHCNIDGSTHSNYFNVKRLDLENTKNNLISFIKIRKSLNREVPLTIYVTTLHNYISIIHKNFGFYPLKLKDYTLIKTPDDFSLIKEEYEKMLEPSKGDSVQKASMLAWGERAQIDTKTIDYNKYPCTKLPVIKKTAYIAPDGTWYACCLDSNNELALGNVIEKSLLEISFSKKRRELIRLLIKRQFAKIGGPCKTVNCCQWLNPLLEKGRGL